jgi:hypothetical protein
MAGWARVLIAGWLVIGVACGKAGWDPEEFGRHHPQVSGRDLRLLADIHPYVLPTRGALLLFLCRWPDGWPIPVSIPSDASDSERAVISQALSSWEHAVGVHFRTVRESDDHQLEIRLVDGSGPADAPPPTATTAAECAVDPSALESAPGEILPARITSATIRIRRARPNLIDEPVAHSEVEMLGALLHELGHALGYQGHTRKGGTVMVRTTGEVRRRGRAVRSGEIFRDAAVEALYRVPNGTVLGRTTLSDGVTSPVDRIADVAVARDLSGPLLRSGDDSARIAWRSRLGTKYVIEIPDIEGVVRNPESLRIVPSPSVGDLEPLEDVEAATPPEGSER